MIKKYKYLVAVLAGMFLAIGGTVFAGQISVPSALSGGQTLVGLSTGNYQATSSLIVTPVGNVGVGTTNPTQVNANARLTVAGISSQDVIASTTDNTTLSDAIFRVYAPGSSMFIGSHGTNQITTQYGITVGGWAEIGAVNSSFGTSNGLLIGTRTTATPIVFGTNSLERMRILSTGAVGIGLTNPGSMLEIQGTSTAATGQAFIAWDSNANRIFQIANNGSTTIGNFGTCNTTRALTTDSSGNITCGTISAGGTVTSVTATNPLFSSGGATPNITTIFSTTTTWGLGNNGFALVGATGIPYIGASSTLGLPNTALLNSSVTVNTSAPLGGGGAVSLGGTLTLTCATCSTFGYPFLSNATSTLLSFTGGLNASSTVNFQNGSTGSQFNWNSSTGRLGLGTSTPYAQFALIATSTTGTNAPAFLFVIASTTAGTATSTLFSVSNTGATQVFTPTNLTNAFSVLNNASTNVFNIDTTGTLPAFQIGTSTGSTPAAELSAIALFGQVPPQNLLFALASSSQIATSTLFSVNNIGAVAINAPLNPSGGDLLTVTSADNSVFSFNRTGFMTLKFKAQDTKDRITFHTIAGSNDTDLDFDSDEAGNTRLFLQGTTGDVGVSSTSPTALLSVAGTVAAKLTAFATGDGAVCQRGSGGLLTLDAGVSSCIVSSQYVKDYLGGDSYDAAWARIQKIQVIEFTYKDTGVADIGAYAEAMANIDPRYAQYATSPRDMDGHHYNVGDPVAINWSAVQADMIVVIQHQSSGAPSKWPYALGVLFIVYIAYNEYRRRV